MSDSATQSSVLIISDDSELVDSLVKNNTTNQEFKARDSVQLILDDPTLLDNNSIVIFDIGSNDNDLDTAIGQVIKIKQEDPTQVLILTGESEILGSILKSNIQPLVYRAFTKPIHANQVFLAFKSGNALHADLVKRQASGEDITAVGPAENRTSVASLASEQKNNTAIYAGIGVAAFAVVAWLLFSGGEEPAPTPVVNETTDTQVDLIEEPVVTVSAMVQRINELNQSAATAMLEERIIAPKGDNALEYYDQVLALDAYDTTAYQGKKAIADRLRESYNQLVSDAEFDRALRVINVLQRIEPLNLQNDALLGGLEKAIDLHVKKVQDTGTSEEVARTSAVLDKLGDTFAGSKSAAEALKKEKAIVAQIDTALDGDVLVPPAKGNAYSLVSDALKSNTVSNANIAPRVKALSAKLLRLAESSMADSQLDEASKLAALVKRLNVDKQGLAALNKKITEAKNAIAAAAVPEEKPVVEEAAPELPKIIPAKIISRSPPRYPNKALNRGIEGWVEVQFTIDVGGLPTEASVVSAEPSGMFETAALRAVKKWRFSPARNEETGLPVQSDPITTKVQFKLE